MIEELPEQMRFIRSSHENHMVSKIPPRWASIESGKVEENLRKLMAGKYAKSSLICKVQRYFLL